MSYIFGPVPSRRLGRSLGIDLVPFKTCSYDCIYCQLSQTTDSLLKPKEWVPLDEVLAELKTKLASQPDYITLSGSGEPTLYSRIGELISGIKAITQIPVAVITNGSLLWDKTIRTQLAKADLVIPSLDAGDEAMFRAINRPNPAITFEKMLQGLIDLRKEFQGQYWLEVMLLANYNATEKEVQKIAKCAKFIKPDRVQLNTATRPPTEDYALAVSRPQLIEFSKMFDPPAEVIADFKSPVQQSKSYKFKDIKSASLSLKAVLQMLQRRPCSLEDIIHGLNIPQDEIVKIVDYLKELIAQNLIEETSTPGQVYYKATDSSYTNNNQERPDE